ncbi:MAG: DUF2059 domain-containing protein [Steroidobacteraceae bacterium]
MQGSAWLFAVAILGFAQPLLAADEAPVSEEFRADVDHLLDMTGAMEVGKRMGVAAATQITAQVKQRHPELPARAIDLIPTAVDEVIDENMGSLRLSLVALYAKYFTDAEVKQMIQFYSTSLGSKLIRVMPLLGEDSVRLGMQWAQTVAPQLEPKVAEMLRAQGFDI